jgi:NADH dehydrogenase/NADH:ubiquinone oxidoreductase subunit G
MMIKASGRSALIVAAGLLVCFAGPLPARAAGGDSAAASKSETSTSGKSVRPSAHHWKRYAHRTRTAAKSSESSKASEKDVADADDSPAVIPASVANANAQMTSTNALANALADSASAMTAKANTMLLASADKPADAAPADAAVVASDQLNDVDRALQETPAKQQTVAMASAAKPVAAAAPVLAAANDSSTWDQTSLIGKIFIAFGALLTMASAARMFMA